MVMVAYASMFPATSASFDAPNKTNEPSPYILIRRNLEAKISRSVFYELIEIAEHFNDKFGVWSGGTFFPFSNSKDVIIDE